jgi:type III secretory pathway component EscS
MSPDTLSHELYVSLLAAATLAGPPLFAAAGFGLVMGLLQAVMQIQDQSLAQVLKIVVISAILFLAVSRLADRLFEETLFLFESFPRLVR